MACGMTSISLQLHLRGWWLELRSAQPVHDGSGKAPASSSDSPSRMLLDHRVRKRPVHTEAWAALLSGHAFELAVVDQGHLAPQKMRADMLLAPGYDIWDERVIFTREHMTANP